MAISASSYSAGNRVYRGGSNAPTRGTVDPTGYVERELNNQSDKRSGLAAAALRSLEQKKAMGGGQPQSTAPGQQNRSAYSPVTGLNATSAGMSRQPGGAKPGVPGVGGGVSHGLRGMQPQVSQLAVSGIGKLSKPDVSSAITGATSMPLGEDERIAEAQVRSQLNAVGNQITSAKSQIEKDKVLQERQLAESRPQDERGLLEDFASRGMAYSSGYTHEYGNMTRLYAQLMDDLKNGRNSLFAELDSQYASFDQDMKKLLDEIRAAAARKAAEQAAAGQDLGLSPDEDAPPPITGDPDVGTTPANPSAGGGGLFPRPTVQHPPAQPQAPHPPQQPAPRPVVHHPQPSQPFTQVSPGNFAGGGHTPDPHFTPPPRVQPHRPVYNAPAVSQQHDQARQQAEAAQRAYEQQAAAQRAAQQQAEQAARERANAQAQAQAQAEARRQQEAAVAARAEMERRAAMANRTANVDYRTLPKRTAANDRLIASLPPHKRTARQMAYADMHGIA